VLDAIEARMAEVSLPDGARRTPREQWHVTVQFFGNEVDVDAVVGALSGVAVGSHEVSLSGAGTLPPERRSKYLVLFLREGEEWMQRLADEVAACVAPLGIQREGRAFTPHLTLARCKAATNLRAPCEAIGPDPVGPPWEATELVVYESRLGNGPVEHIPRATIPLH
jgi:2'-5' RNA ligase